MFYKYMFLRRSCCCGVLLCLVGFPGNSEPQSSGISFDFVDCLCVCNISDWICAAQ
jgi:hypothetical protein